MTPLLEARGLVKHFPVRRGLFGGPDKAVRAVDDVSFVIEPGATLGLVGESGCGKTTTAKLVLLLERPTAGEIRFDGESLATLDAERLRRYRHSVQAVFQDPYASLNPRMRVGAIIAEPLVTNEKQLSSAEVGERLRKVLDLVGLPARAAELFPHEFSGGQRQRIAIARALTLSPRLIVLDEPVSALDVSIRAQILRLILDLQQRLGLSYIFISHDLGVVKRICDRIAVMYLGRIVEIGPADAVCRTPRHPYTEALLRAIPIADPRRMRVENLGLIEGDGVTAAKPGACAFEPRCPHRFQPCGESPPVLCEVGAGHKAACFLNDSPKQMEGS